MKRKELARFTYEKIEYIIGVDFWIDDIPSPFILITSKSSNRIRGKMIEKGDSHYKRITLKNPIGFYKKVYPIFKKELGKYDIVHFSAYNDDTEKRERVYKAAISKMGFELAYIYKSKNYNSDFIMAKKGIKIKRKKIIKQGLWN
jgi:hypothetical protein